MLGMFDRVIAPAAARFRPDLVLVSAGFDAHWRDPFQGLQLRCGGRDRAPAPWLWPRQSRGALGGRRHAAAVGN